MGEIQNYINDHLTVENCFVKSIQVTGKSDSEVVVPKGFNIRFINCIMEKVIAQDSALHMLACSVDEYHLNECIVSIDGGQIEKDLYANNSRINIKELPGDLASDDTSFSQMNVNGSVHLTNCESFWNTVKWEMSEASTIENSRVEIVEGTFDFKAKLSIIGSEFYCIGGKIDSSSEIEIKELEAIASKSPEQDVLDSGAGGSSASTNNVRGAAGVGAGSIANFKKLESVMFSSQGCFKVTGSECNIYDVPSVRGDESHAVPIITYENSCGKIANSKDNPSQWFSRQINVNVKGTGSIHLSDTKLQVPEDIPNPTVKIEEEEEEGVNFTMVRGKTECFINDCFQMKGGFLELYELEVISACNNDITINGGTAILYNCKAVVADNNCFEGSGGCVVESNNTQTLDAAVYIFKGDDARFILRGSTELKAGEKDVKGSGVFVGGAPTIIFKELQDISKYVPGSGSGGSQ